MKIRTSLSLILVLLSGPAWGGNLPKLSCKEAWKTKASAKTGEPYYIFDFKTQGYEAYLNDEVKRKKLGCDEQGLAYLGARGSFQKLEPTESTLKLTMSLLDQVVEAFPARSDRKKEVKAERQKLFQIFEHYSRMKRQGLKWIEEVDPSGEKLGELKAKFEALPDEAENYEAARKLATEKNAAWRNCASSAPYVEFVEEQNKNVTRKKFENPVPRSECYKEWTVLVAMDGKSDLMPFSLWDILEMEAGFEARRDAGSTLKKDVLVQHAGTEDDQVRRLQIFQTATHYNEHKPKLTQQYFNSRSIHDVESPVVEVHAEADFKGKADEFVQFVKWGMKNYPAKRYVVILWGHGKGWFKTDETDEGVHLSGFQLAEALKAIHTDEDGLNGEKKLDHFIADACFMQGVELATELASHATYISGSAQIQAFMGLPYRVMFFEMEQTGKNFKRELRAKLKKEGKWKDVPRGEKGRVDWLAMGYSPLKMTAEYLPRVMHRGFSSPSSFQGRLVQEDGAVQKGLEFFTFSTMESKKVVSVLEPALQNFAAKFVAYYSDEESRLDDLKFRLIDISPFRGKSKTRELGSFLQLTDQSVAKIVEELKAKLKEDGLSEEEINTVKSELEKAEALLAAAENAHKALIEAVPVAYFASMYQEPFDWFRALGVWIPKNLRNYQKGIGYGYDETQLFQADASAWDKMIRLIAIDDELFLFWKNFALYDE